MSRAIPSPAVRRAPAVAAEFQIDCRRQRIRFDRNDGEDIRGLIRAWAAEREEVIGADRDARVARLAPVAGEGAVAEIAALGRFQIRERDIVASDFLPVDDALMMRHVDPTNRIAIAIGPVLAKPPPRRECDDCGEHR